MAVTVFPMVTPRTWLTLDAGSVLTSRTRLPWLTRCKAVAQATEVLPAPPLPVKNRNRGGLSRNFMPAPLSAAAGGAATAAGLLGQTKFRHTLRGCGSLGLGAQSGVTHQLLTRGVGAGHDGQTINQRQRQTVRTRHLKERSHGVAAGERRRIVGEVVPLDVGTHFLEVIPVSYTHLRAHETRHDLVCRLLLEKK